ncbi:MAG: fibronectin type III domain-containing protein, partial [Thermoleophilia bacterium]|nr:fibronectin type III domain-containing protein [Thermoleophilia bacterium]
ALSTTYYYRAYASNKKGDSPYSNIASATTTVITTVPAAPSGLSAAEVSASQINLAWTDNAGNEDGSEIERSLSASSGFAQIAAVGANVTSYASTGLSADTTYYYRVRAYNSAGDSAYSNTASATTTTVPPVSGPPAAPTDLTATGATDHINLNWADNSTNEDCFDIWRRAEGGYWLPLTQVAANVTSYGDYSAQPDILYYYLVRAHNPSGSSDWSNTASATLDGVGSPEPPTAPSGVSATAISSSRIDLTWSDTSDSEDGVRIERSLSASSGFVQIATVGANVTAYSSTALSAYTTYYYRVCAYNDSGSSAYSNTASATTFQVAPAGPTGLAAAAVSSSQINLSWRDNSTNESGFKIERSLSSTTGFSPIATVGANVVSYSNSGLSASTTYYYRVRAYNTAGDSAYSNTASASTGQTVPSAPTNLNATPASSSQINLSWTDASSNETGFKIERSFSATSGFSQIATLGANATSYSNTGLSPGTLYAYRVRAYNAAGNSAYSNTAVTNTLDVPPAAPSGLTAAAVSSSQIDLTWVDNSTNETGFEVERSLSATTGFALVASVGANVTSYQNTGLSPSTTYYYKVRARNTAGASGYSATASAVTLAATTIPVGGARDVVTDGSYAYVASDLYGIVVVDVRDPANPRGVASLNLGFVPLGLDRSGSLLVVTGANHGIVVVDVGNPLAPRVIGSLSAYAAYQVAVDSRFCYITDAAGFLRVVDLIDPTSPAFVAELPVGGVPIEIAVSDGYAYIAANGSLLVVDVTAPGSPYVLSSLAVPCRVVAVDGRYAYADGAVNGGLLVVDIADPSQPIVVGERMTLTIWFGLAVQDSYVYVVQGSRYGSSTGFSIMDAIDPASPVTTLSTYTDQASGVAVFGAYAYLADGPAGLDVFDISDPYNPVLVGTAQ